MTGKTFGRLTVIELDKDRIEQRKVDGKKKITYWFCKCECGNIKSIESYSLTTCKSTSCGCYGREQRLKSQTKHNLSHTRIKRIYYNMRSRCYNSNTPKYNNHGGRGIKVCDEWLSENGLVKFNDWAMNNGYDENLTLDRINNDGNYEPNNCRWVDYNTQNYNRRVNRIFTIGCETGSAREFCDKYNIKWNTFWERVFNGYEGEDLIYNGNLKDKYKNN